LAHHTHHPESYCTTENTISAKKNLAQSLLRHYPNRFAQTKKKTSTIGRLFLRLRTLKKHTMAPVEGLVARAYRCDYYGRCYNSNWYNWGRWVVAAIAVGIFLLVLFSCLLVSRRRRRRGVQPMYGTGWMAPGKHGNQHNNHQMHDYNYNQNQGGDFQQQQAYGGYPPAPPPPAYGQQHQYPQHTGTTFNTNDGYYGQNNQQSYGVQPPDGTHQRGEVYSPPQGPPPGK